MIRKIVKIDREKCDGCGLCVPSCAEGAIRIEDGKAVLAADNLCDGLGACLGECPQDAITIVEREADGFDEVAVAKHLGGVSANAPISHQHNRQHGGCPGSRAMSLSPEVTTPAAKDAGRQSSQLRQWPIQLHLVPVSAPYLDGADLLIAADCVPFAYPEFHRDFLSGKVVLVGCPKLDDNSYYGEKLAEILSARDIRSVTVVRMEVPCCGGIVTAARQALRESGREIPFTEVTVGINGAIK